MPEHVHRRPKEHRLVRRKASHWEALGRAHLDTELRTDLEYRIHVAGKMPADLILRNVTDSLDFNIFSARSDGNADYVEMRLKDYKGDNKYLARLAGKTINIGGQPAPFRIDPDDERFRHYANVLFLGGEAQLITDMGAKLSIGRVTGLTMVDLDQGVEHHAWVPATDALPVVDSWLGESLAS